MSQCGSSESLYKSAPSESDEDEDDYLGATKVCGLNLFQLSFVGRHRDESLANPTQP